MFNNKDLYVTLAKYPTYDKLHKHINKLLKYHEEFFGSDISAYVIYLAYLVKIENFSDLKNLTIRNGINRVELLLRNPSKYWFANDIVDQADTQSEIKRKIIKWIILDILELYFKQNMTTYTPLRKIKSDLEKFINNYKDNLIHDLSLESLQNLNDIFNQNMEFAGEANPRISRSLNISKDIGKIGLTCFTMMLLFLFYTDDRDLPKSTDVDKLAAIVHKLGQYPDEHIPIAAVFFIFLYSFYIRLFDLLPNAGSFANNQQVPLKEFLEYLKKDPELRPLYSEPPIDSLWLQKSHLKDKNSPIFLKQYFEFELTQLNTNMTNEKFITLLMGLLQSKKFPNFNDKDLYTVSINLLAKPQEAWMRNKFKNYDYNLLILNYMKIVLADIAKKILENEIGNYSGKSQLILYIQKERDEIEKQIEKIENRSSLKYQDPFKKYIPMFSSGALIGYTGIFFGKTLLEYFDPANFQTGTPFYRSLPILIYLVGSAIGFGTGVFLDDKLRYLYKKIRDHRPSQSVDTFIKFMHWKDSKLNKILPPENNSEMLESAESIKDGKYGKTN